MKDKTVGELLQKLYTVDDMTWGRYAFSKEMLRGRISDHRRDEMIKNALLCGDEWAQRVQAQTNASAIEDIVKAFDLHVTESEQPMTEKRVLFAQFIPERSIEIMSQPLDTYAALCGSEAVDEYASLFPPVDEIRRLLLAHEVFHYVEETNTKQIYTRTETIRLWKVFGFKNDSTVRTIGEIAAMSFARALTGVVYNPFILDFLLFVGYNRLEAEGVCSNLFSPSI